jgi:hypothetical protein
MGELATRERKSSKVRRSSRYDASAAPQKLSNEFERERSSYDMQEDRARCGCLGGRRRRSHRPEVRGHIPCGMLCGAAARGLAEVQSTRGSGTRIPCGMFGRASAPWLGRRTHRPWVQGFTFRAECSAARCRSGPGADRIRPRGVFDAGARSARNARRKIAPRSVRSARRRPLDGRLRRGFALLRPRALWQDLRQP